MTDTCDRCVKPTPATTTVRCHLGCIHRQCAECAEWTTREAANEEIDRKIGRASGV